MNTDLMIVGATGFAYLGPVGSTMPTSASATPDAAFKDFGAISDDGLTEANSSSWQAFKPWGRIRKAKNSQTDSGKTFQLTFWETNPDVLQLYYNLPTRPTVTPGASGAPGTMSFAEPEVFVPSYWALIVDTIEGPNRIREAITKIQVTDRGNRVFNQQNVVGYQVTCDVVGSVQHYVAAMGLA